MKHTTSEISSIFFTAILLTICCYTRSTSASNLSENKNLRIEEESTTLLDTARDVITIHWEIRSAPYKYYLHYYNMSNEINRTILNAPEFDLEPFLGAHGVWVFPYTFKFDELFYAYFKPLRHWVSYERLEITGYLHNNAELRIFDSSSATEPSTVFRGTTEGWWETFVVVVYSWSHFRVEIHVNETGGFGFIDKMIGYRKRPTTRPPVTVPTEGVPTTIIATPVTGRPTEAVPTTIATPTVPTCPTEEPPNVGVEIISRESKANDDCPTCNCNCNCNCEGLA